VEPLRRRRPRRGTAAPTSMRMQTGRLSELTSPQTPFLGLKQWRGIVTRDDQHALTVLGGVLLTVAITTRPN